MGKKIFYAVMIMTVIGLLILWGYSGNTQFPVQNPSIFSLETSLHGKWSDVKQENTVYFFSDYTFVWQRPAYSDIIGKYKITKMDEKQFFLTFEIRSPGEFEIRIYKFILTGTYDSNNRFAAFTLEPLEINGEYPPVTLRREPNK